VLAVIKHDHRAALAECRLECLDDRLWRQLVDAKRLRDCSRDDGRIAERPEVDPPHAIRVPIQQTRRGLRGEPSLAAAARPRQRQEPRSFMQPLDLGDLSLPPDEACELERKIAWRRTQSRREAIDAHAFARSLPTMRLHLPTG
jgi:hypothetical protein